MIIRFGAARSESALMNHPFVLGLSDTSRIHPSGCENKAPSATIGVLAPDSCAADDGEDAGRPAQIADPMMIEGFNRIVVPGNGGMATIRSEMGHSS
jgi:hypothetical protein